MSDGRPESSTASEVEALLDGIRQGNHRALARAISVIEDRRVGYTTLVSALYEKVGSASILGVTGSPGSGKSTLVDALIAQLRDRGETVGVLAVDPASPFSGGAVLGDRIRLSAAVDDDGVFVRSMSARGALGGLAAAADDVVVAMDAFGFDRIIVETVGTGQSEIDVVRTADTVALLVPPDSGDDVQTLKAGVLEIADLFVVNKADRSGADRTVSDLVAMLDLADGRSPIGASHHGESQPEGLDDDRHHTQVEEDWRPPIVETVATEGTGVDALLDAVDDHRRFLEKTGEGEARRNRRHAAAIRRLVARSIEERVADRLERVGGVDALADRVRRGETDPYAIVDRLFDPVESVLEVDSGEESDRGE